MTKYLFILGRNPELSIAELQAVLGDFNFKHKGNAILAELQENAVGNSLIERLGGTIAIGKVLTCGKDFEKELHSKMLYHGTKNSMNYVLWNFSSDEGYARAQKYLKKRFREEKLRATEKQISGKMELQNGESVPSLPSDKLVDEQFFVFGDCFGEIIETCDYEELEKRDMEKPVRRESLAISPRLAKIMINISGVKSGGSLVDCFCGVGVILQEAILNRIYVVGIDKDENAIKSAKKNLGHIGARRGDYTLIRTDSGRANIKPVDVLVTEPDLGEILKRAPTEEKARKTLQGYEGLIIRVLNNLKKDVRGKMVFTAPLIKTSRKKRIGCNIGDIIKRTGLKLAKGFPISEFREGQVVGREIFVLEHIRNFKN